MTLCIFFYLRQVTSCDFTKLSEKKGPIRFILLRCHSVVDNIHFCIISLFINQNLRDFKIILNPDLDPGSVFRGLE